MKSIYLLISLLIFVCPAQASPVRAVGDFALIDHQGVFHQLSQYSDYQAVVLYSYSSEGDATSGAVDKLSFLQDKYEGRNIAFLMVDATLGETRARVAESLGRHRDDIPVLMDSSQLVSYSLKIDRTGEVLVIDPIRMQLLYRGAIDSRAVAAVKKTSDSISRNYLDEVLSAVTLNGPEVPDVLWEGGQSISFEDLTSELSVSYASDVVPILEQRCVSCHRDGGVAPWSMDSHQMVSGWSEMMRETLLTMRMPPGQIDDTYLDNFTDVHAISDSEKRTLVSWIDSGAEIGGSDDPLTRLEAQASGWALGEPDLIVEFPAQEIPATGALDYKFIPVEIGLDRDRWVRAYAFDIGDKSVLHHVVAYTQDSKQQKQNSSGGGSRTNFGGYAPGRDYVEFDDNTGVLLKEDMRFMVQFHYTTVGRPITDVTRIGLYFQDEAPEFPLSRTAIMNGEFVIPPGDSDFDVLARATIVKDSYLYNIAPHMHYRGKRVKYWAEYPDGTREDILSIPNFQHNWQMIYRLKQPKLLPAGTVIVSEGAFDNSANNALNPDPSQEVRWGDQVWDEMFIAWMRVSELK